jgi:CheY-specific phosphatase CheX
LARFFGQYLLEKGILSRQQLLDALAKQRSKVEKLGELAVRKGYLKPEDVERIHREQQKTDLFFGQLAVKMGLLTEEQVNELLNIQRSNHVFLGEVLVELGYLTKAQVEEELKKFQHEEEEISFSVAKDFPYSTILNILASTAEKQFRRVADMRVKFSEPKEETGETPNLYVSIFLDLKGDIQASLLLKLSAEVAHHVAKHLLKDSKLLQDEAYVKDAASEFFNILCGNLLSKFMEIGKSCDISVPLAYFSTERKTLSLEGKKAFTIPLTTTEGPASISFVPK